MRDNMIYKQFVVRDSAGVFYDAESVYPDNRIQSIYPSTGDTEHRLSEQV